MPPTIALILWAVFLLALLRFDPAKEPNTSWVLWIPLTWMFIIGSRLPSQWLGTQVAGQSAQALEDGNPLDRAIFTALILIAILILFSRSFNWNSLIARNLFLVGFLLFALISVVWSDYPFVAFKRWFRDLGNYLMILVVLSDPHPLEATRTFLRRLCYLLIPLSVVLIKYFPQMSKHYDAWTGMASVDGVTTSKNMLGVACLISGMFLFWDTATRWHERKDRRTKWIIWINIGFVAMTLWVLSLSNSATSRVCLALGCVVILAAHCNWGRRHTSLIRIMIPASFVLYLVLAFGMGLMGEMASQIGRDPTLTDRTIIWKAVLSTNTNPLVGTGYESFWLGPRLQRVWEMAGHVNEAHNGYLEVYLNLGLVGLALLVGFLVSSYRRISRILLTSSSLASFSLALWTVMLFYNVTEAAFKSSLIWLMLLLVGIAAPESVGNLARSASVSIAVRTHSRSPRLPLERMICGDGNELH